MRESTKMKTFSVSMSMCERKPTENPSQTTKDGCINFLPIIVATLTSPTTPHHHKHTFTHLYTHIKDHRITQQVISSPYSPTLSSSQAAVIAREDKAGVVVLKLVVTCKPFATVIQLVNHSELS